MSAKLRLTLWQTLMVLLLCVLVLIFVLVINSRSLPDDPASYLIHVVLDNAGDVEFDQGRFEWGDLDVYKRGVYCSFYDADGKLLLSANREGMDFQDLPFEANRLRTVGTESDEYYLYDAYVDMSVTGLWIRGLISSSSSTGLMHTILVLTASVLPVILLLTLAGGWLIAWLSLRPVERIADAADSISDGGDLSARIALKKGPREFRRLAASFDRMFERLEKSFQAERQFTSDASHELRTPVTVILAECDHARRKAKTEADFREALSLIEQQGQRMSELVQQLLSFTRIQQGIDRYPVTDVDLSQLTASCCEDYPEDRKHGISIQTGIDEQVLITGNASLLSRAVYNLLQNAHSYGREGGSVLVTLKKDGDYALLSVKDDGIGIAEENLDKIWNRFWQADPSREASGSTGLGLSMVKEIAEFHKGFVSVQSRLGEGSVFTLHLPLLQ